MKWKITTPQKRLYLITAIILLVGLGSAILIYLKAENDSHSVLGYEVVGERKDEILSFAQNDGRSARNAG